MHLHLDVNGNMSIKAQHPQPPTCSRRPRTSVFWFFQISCKGQMCALYTANGQREKGSGLPKPKKKKKKSARQSAVRALTDSCGCEP